MARVMLFVDGTWLYQNMARLLDYTEDRYYQIDFNKLPQSILEELGGQQPGLELDFVRGFMFGAFPVKVDPMDEMLSQRQKDFYTRMREDFFYHVETYPVNFKGRRIRRSDRDPTDPFHPREAQASISLATTALQCAHNHAFDIAAFLIGDRDYKPAIRAIRRFGKRTVVISIRNSCTPEFSSSHERAMVADFNTIWMDDMVNEIQLTRELPSRSAPYDDGEHGEGAARPQVSYNQRQKQLEEIEQDRQRAIDEGEEVYGAIKTVKIEKGFGFLTSDSGEDYFFHYTDLDEGLEFSEELMGMPVSFFIVRPPDDQRAGAATHVCIQEQDDLVE